MKQINLLEIRAQFAGTRFRQLVQHHLQHQSHNELITAIEGTISSLPAVAQGVIETFIDRWIDLANDQGFWQRDSSDGQIVI